MKELFCNLRETLKLNFLMLFGYLYKNFIKSSVFSLSSVDMLLRMKNKHLNKSNILILVNLNFILKQ